MSLVRCTKCGCVENTACCHWFDHLEDKQYLCSECDPEIGRWHGRFAKTSADGFFFDDSHLIYEPEEVDMRTMRWKYNKNFKMIGRIVDGALVVL